ncbi:MAG: EVE domain-containing protein [Idiomarina sp.]|nr:EVE domain-containing protein [Idiomarina sp.]
MQYWLMKTEPDECSIDDFRLAPSRPLQWDGVRNYQARNFMRSMEVGDQVLLYHSSCKNIGVAGLIRVAKSAYPDPKQFDDKSPYFDPKSTKDKPRWDAVDLVFEQKFEQVISLDKLKGCEALVENPLVKKGNRLSVIPFSEDEFQAVLALTK